MLEASGSVFPNNQENLPWFMAAVTFSGFLKYGSSRPISAFFLGILVRCSRQVCSRTLEHRRSDACGEKGRLTTAKLWIMDCGKSRRGLIAQGQ